MSSLITQALASMFLPSRFKDLKTFSNTKLRKRPMISKYLGPFRFPNLRKMSALDMEARLVATAVIRAVMVTKEVMVAVRVVTVSPRVDMGSKAMASDLSNMDSPRAAMDSPREVMVNRDNNKTQTEAIIRALYLLETSVSSIREELMSV